MTFTAVSFPSFQVARQIQAAKKHTACLTQIAHALA